jgi:hypothetical protein
MKRELSRAIVANVIGAIILVVFFTALEWLTPISVSQVLMESLPAMAAGIIGGLVGSYIVIRRKPDERMQLILKQSARNAFWVLLLTIPFVSLAFMFLPTQTGMVYGIYLFLLWIVGVTVFYLSMIVYYYA